MSRTELGDDLDVKVDEARLARGWERIEARSFGPRRSWRPVAIGSVGLAAAAALVGLAVWWPWAPPGPLEAHGAPADRSIAAAAERGDTVALDDGSRIRFAPASVVEPLENGGARFSVLLREGAARFEVEPEGPRRWVVEAGHVTVEVVGTVFRVQRDADEVRVEVERGRVLVRSDQLEERVRALGPGESVRVAAPAVAAAPSAAPMREVETPSTGRPEIAPTPPEAAEPRAERALAPSVPEVLPAPDPVAPGSPARDAATLLASADDARRAGDIATALARLAAAAALDGDPDAPIAAFTRGRLAMRHGRAAEAIDDFERALALGLPRSIEESARYRLVSAHARAGDPASARRAADDYLARYPEGAFRADVERERP